MLIQSLNEPPFGATITDFDCAIPINNDAADEIRLALHHHQLLVIPNQQHLTPQQEVAFYRSIDINGLTIWRDQTNNPWEVFKVAQGNKAGLFDTNYGSGPICRSAIRIVF